MQRGNGIASFFRGLFRFVKPLLYSGAKAVGKEALKKVSNIITFLIKSLNNLGVIFLKSFSEAKVNLEEKIKKMTVFGLGLKRKRKLKKTQSQRKVDIFTENKMKEK